MVRSLNFYIPWHFPQSLKIKIIYFSESEIGESLASEHLLLVENPTFSPTLAGWHFLTYQEIPHTTYCQCQQKNHPTQRDRLIEGMQIINCSFSAMTCHPRQSIKNISNWEGGKKTHFEVVCYGRDAIIFTVITPIFSIKANCESGKLKTEEASEMRGKKKNMKKMTSFLNSHLFFKWLPTSSFKKKKFYKISRKTLLVSPGFKERMLKW